MNMLSTFFTSVLWFSTLFVIFQFLSGSENILFSLACNISCGKNSQFSLRHYTLEGIMHDLVCHTKWLARETSLRQLLLCRPDFNEVLDSVIRMVLYKCQTDLVCLTLACFFTIYQLETNGIMRFISPSFCFFSFLLVPPTFIWHVRLKILAMISW